MNIVRLYNQNRRKFWGAIIIIAFILILIQSFNYIAENKNNKDIGKQTNTVTNYGTATTSTSKVISNTSGVTGGKVYETELEKTQKVLNKFFDYCNNKNLEQAYNMLTDECKQLIYPTLDLFEANYYNNIFEGKRKNYLFENWNGDTYRIKIKEDALANGYLSSDDNEKIDYVTIKNDKLNISTYIGRKQINKETTLKGVTVTINRKDTYMDYEVYNITVKNDTNNNICLGNVNDSGSIFLRDSRSARYGMYNHELIESMLVIGQKSIRTLDIKFYSSYVSTKELQKIVFNDMSLNYRNGEKGEIYTFVADL